ncbi:MAG: pentapeptide repeat-containing protein [Myxococcales bacterium]
MSEMYDVTVVNRGQTWVDLRVRQVHPDAGRVSESKGFALQLLLVEAYRFNESYDRVPNGPLGEAIGFDQSYDAETCDELAETYVKSSHAYKAVNVPFDEQASHAAVDQRVLARGIARDSEGWADAWQDEWREWWHRPDGPPYVTLRVEVTDPRWVAHLQPGKCFDTAAWAPSGPSVDEDRDEKPGFPADAILPAALVDFPLAGVPRGERSMDPQLVLRMAGAAQPLQGAALEEAARAHAEFLGSGGRDGDWELLSVSGMPLCVYTGAKAERGTQLVLRLKKVAEGASLAGKDLAHSDLSGSLCKGVAFAGARLDRSVAIDAFFDEADFSNASLRQVDFSGSSLKGCRFQDADLRGADFEHTDCTGADFTGARLEGARFPGAILERVRR